MIHFFKEYKCENCNCHTGFIMEKGIAKNKVLCFKCTSVIHISEDYIIEILKEKGKNK